MPRIGVAVVAFGTGVNDPLRTVVIESGPKIVNEQPDPEPDSADVAARRMTTDSSSPKASHSATYRNVGQTQATSRTTSCAVRHDAEAEHPEAGDERDDRHQDESDDRHPGRELAVDDVVAVDRLGQEARQGPLRSLAVDGVEREREAEQRRDDRRRRRRPGGSRCPASRR